MELRARWQLNRKCPKGSEDGRVSEVMNSKPAFLMRCDGGV